MIGVIIFSLLSGIGFSLTLIQSVAVIKIIHDPKYVNDKLLLIKAMFVLVCLFAFTLQGIAYTFAYASGY